MKPTGAQLQLPYFIDTATEQSEDTERFSTFTENTFYPPGSYSQVNGNSQLQAVEEKKKEKPIETILYTDVFGTDAPKTKKRKYWLPLVLVLVLVAGGVAFSLFYFGIGPFEAEAEEEEVEFCEEFGVTDSEVRQIFADSFDDSIGDFFMNFVLPDLPCLPSNAFGGLSEAQRLIMSEKEVLTIDGQGEGLEVIHVDAFNDVLVEEITGLFLQFHQLTELPNGIFRRFNSISELVLNGNIFESLDNDIFNGEVPTMETFQFGFTDTLTAFPEIMLLMPNLETIFVQGADSLTEANPEVFEGIEDVEIIFRGDDPPPVLVNLGITGLAQALNLLDSSQITNEGNAVDA